MVANNNKQTIIIVIRLYLLCMLLLYIIMLCLYCSCCTMSTLDSAINEDTILLHIHISKASSHLVSSCPIVDVPDPYSTTLHINAFIIRFLLIYL